MELRSVLFRSRRVRTLPPAGRLPRPHPARQAGDEYRVRIFRQEETGVLAGETALKSGVRSQESEARRQKRRDKTRDYEYQGPFPYMLCAVRSLSLFPDERGRPRTNGLFL